VDEVVVVKLLKLCLLKFTYHVNFCSKYDNTDSCFIWRCKCIL